MAWDKDTMNTVTTLASNMILLGIILCFILAGFWKKLNVSEDAAAAMFPALITFCYDAADMNGKRFFWEYILESNSLVFEDAE